MVYYAVILSKYIIMVHYPVLLSVYCYYGLYIDIYSFELMIVNSNGKRKTVEQ